MFGCSQAGRSGQSRIEANLESAMGWKRGGRLDHPLVGTWNKEKKLVISYFMALIHYSEHYTWGKRFLSIV